MIKATGHSHPASSFHYGWVIVGSGFANIPTMALITFAAMIFAFFLPKPDFRKAL